MQINSPTPTFGHCPFCYLVKYRMLSGERSVPRDGLASKLEYIVDLAKRSWEIR
jgi:hypothetical protein